jgi:hypothetical protein
MPDICPALKQYGGSLALASLINCQLLLLYHSIYLTINWVKCSGEMSPLLQAHSYFSISQDPGMIVSLISPTVNSSTSTGTKNFLPSQIPTIPSQIVSGYSYLYLASVLQTRKSFSEHAGRWCLGCRIYLHVWESYSTYELY